MGATLSYPVEYGLATSLARPGGNLTGVTDDAGPEISAKELSLLTEAVPGTSRLAQQLGVALVATLMDGPFQEAQYLEAFRTMAGNGAQALLIGSVGEHFVNRRLIVELAAKHRQPMMAPGRVFVEDGGLLAYGISAPDNWRRAALHVE